jgi:hypothetical protein
MKIERRNSPNAEAKSALGLSLSQGEDRTGRFLTQQTLYIPEAVTIVRRTMGEIRDIECAPGGLPRGAAEQLGCGTDN